MSTKINETMKKLDEKIAQLQAQKKAEQNKLKQQAKKERTKRLFKYGELVEKYLKCETPEQLEEILKNHFTELKNTSELVKSNPFTNTSELLKNYKK